MRILHLIPHLSGGGAERQLSYLAPELAHLGHDVHIVYSKEGPQRPELALITLHQLKSQSNYHPFLLWQLVRIIRRIKPDVIHSWIPQMDILGGIAARLNGVPWIFREASSATAYSRSWRPRLRIRVASGARAIVSNSRGGDEYWRTELPHNRRYIVPNGLPLNKIYRTVAALPPGLEKPTAPIVLFVGRLIQSKNLQNLLEVLKCVRKQRRVLGVLCGEGPQRSELEELRRKLELERDLHFTGNLPATSVWALMKEASIFISLSAYEGCPNAVMEALACRCPLVLSDIPAHHDVLEESFAHFVDPSNIQQTANYIIRLLSDADTSKGIALTRMQKTNEWSIFEVARSYERIYQEVI